MGIAYQTIEASGFRTGEYVGYTPSGHAVRIKRSKIGWHIYHAFNEAARPYVGFQRKTLKELDELLCRRIPKQTFNVAPTKADIFGHRG